MSAEGQEPGHGLGRAACRLGIRRLPPACFSACLRPAAWPVPVTRAKAFAGGWFVIGSGRHNLLEINC